MISWIKRNKLTSVLILVVLYLIARQYFGVVRPLSLTPAGLGGTESLSLKSVGSNLYPAPDREYTPIQKTDRLVVQESNLSLVVKNVRESVDKIIDHAKSVGGYMVSSSLSQPEEAPFANVVIRVPSKNLKDTLGFLRSLAFKVSSENLYGYDVTDQYVDIQARLDTLNKTKAKFEEIMTKAIVIADILTVQRELINLQDQIDSLKGQQQYLEKTAELARITIYLSTDEFALPYAPSESFRPAVILKQAVRSLVGTLRSIIKALIWIGVYGVIIVPVALVIWYFKKRKKSSLSS